MDGETTAMVALQLLSLVSVVSGLVLYLVCKVRRNQRGSSSKLLFSNIGGGRAVLVTSSDNLLGLHLALHLVTRGFRVFAGVQPTNDDVGSSTAKRVLEAKLKHLEANSEPGVGHNFGSLVVLPLDVTREDLLHDAVGTIRRHLPAGEDGLWAVVNTAGLACRRNGQDTAYWDAVVKLNITGTLKVCRTFTPLLRTKRGRLINVGAQIRYGAADEMDLAAHTAARYAVEGASAALRHEMRPLGISVVTLQPEGLPIARLFAKPSIPLESGADTYVQCEVRALSDRSLDIVEEAILAEVPNDSYLLAKSPGLLALTDRLLAKPVHIV